MSVKNVVLIGATGSIGKNTLRVIAAHPDRLRLVGAANRSRCEDLEAIGKHFGVKRLVCCSRDGEKALCELAALPEADIVVMAAGGTVCLAPTLAAIEAGKTIALASKEVLVMAGAFVMEAARRKGVRILPVDSEHNAIFQCLDGRAGGVEKLILTASGGPFRDASIEEMRSATPEQALRHPNWSMGPKITIDSATMVNKGLEMIEARWLFDVAPEKIEVTIHPQSIVHSMVEFVDGSILAQLAPPSMTFAIQHALLYPERRRGVEAPLDFARAMSLSFSPPNPVKFPALSLARQAMLAGGSAPAVFNAANEVAVDAFIKGEIPFLAIASIIEQTLSRVPILQPESLEELLEADARARTEARAAIK
ncbi:MAG: 1-deoxy-D-xylulose-5-phosphate reductoisomerase [Opitutales bacterium]|nr:1-deoxy-D-xylulose-5-phosphate reductoisomerase [Opitutales bacterium]